MHSCRASPIMISLHQGGTVKRSNALQPGIGPRIRVWSSQGASVMTGVMKTSTMLAATAASSAASSRFSRSSGGRELGMPMTDSVLS
jgi:phage-related minor tail protein